MDLTRALEVVDRLIDDVRTTMDERDAWTAVRAAADAAREAQARADLAEVAAREAAFGRPVRVTVPTVAPCGHRRFVEPCGGAA